MGRLIRIIESDDHTEEWQAQHPDGEKFDSYYTLRPVPRDIQRQFRKQTTRGEWLQGMQIDVPDNTAFSDLCLDYAILGWKGVTGKGGRELPCGKEYKLRQPEWIKFAIFRMCVNNELAMAVAAQQNGHSPLAQAAAALREKAAAEQAAESTAATR